MTQPDIFYSYQPSADFPELGAGGIGPMAGPAAPLDPASPAAARWPADLTGTVLFYEWVRDFVAAFHLSAEGRLERIESLRGQLLAHIGESLAPNDDAGSG